MFYAILGCIHALLMLCPCVYRAIFAHYYIYTRTKNVPIILFSFTGLISCIVSIGLSVGVILAVSCFVSSLPVLSMIYVLGWTFVNCSVKKYYD